MQENSRPMAARVGALSATALLAVSGTFIAGPAMAGTTDPETPPVTTPAAEPTTPAAEPTTPAADPTTPAAPTPSASPTATPVATPVLEIATDSVIILGQSLKGTASGATALNVSWGGADPVIVPVAADGSFTLTAPTEVGMTTLSMNATNGTTSSEYSTYRFEVLAENQLPSPAFTSPGYVENSMSTIAGTGTPGATVNLTVIPDTDELYRPVGDPIMVPVAEDGTWSHTLSEPLSYGRHYAEAFQTQEGKEDSPSSGRSLSVAPPAPVFTTLPDATVVPINQLPAYITGTGMPGAEIEVIIDYDRQLDAIGDDPEAELSVFEGNVDENGNWAVSTEGLTVGSHEVMAIQAVNDVSSRVGRSNFIITEAAAADPADPADPANTTTPGGIITVTGGTGTGTGTTAGSNLAETGAQNVGLLAGGGAALLAAGAAALVLAKRRRTVSDS
ncbi:LPXTG cell wall anchor domain-containing protein [Arthrobacter sp. zg-Y826]|uniref:LPXTG cell wall anchor domain-containing protein n=1 Tax=Arthrobacter jinronghuae TaxID=2964609 RepID=UPI0021078625|nr:LPXTG cell wall anchor domain-containing protein [Arthrobacter jinronghuae]MCQ1955929.1 LPXTG cell wall anchor domain-containing protein [Arthrobacter jinronghuae]